MPDENQTHDTKYQSQESDHEPAAATEQPVVHQPHATGTQDKKAIAPNTSPEHPEAVPAGPSSAITNPAQLVLQWLVYALWGWSALAISWLTFLVVQYFLNEEGAREATNDMLPYSLASVIVLVLISLASDMFYARKEPTRKSGAAMVVMVIHAVIFALFAIGWLIAAVFGGIRILIGGWSVDAGALTLIIAALIVSTVYVATLLRTLRPTGRGSIVRGYWVFVGAVVIALIAAGVMGPAVQAGLRQQDRVIENGLPEISRAINEYARDKKELPSSLSVLKTDLTGDAKRIVEADKVRYTPKGELPSAAPALQEEPKESREPSANPTIYPPVATDRQTFRYQLCVDYLTEKKHDSYGYPAYGRDERTRYDVTPNTYSHDKGETCYDLQTDYAMTLM